ncbi:uncharacterized protein [Anabrus simplex]|uniref:uncharacterized protein n=1 Tax=Anabrus simplex TaxID=316456 RepID=UPI0035A33F70
MADVDSEILITLVQARPVLWDKTLDIYKDRNATRKAWREVCLELKPDFDVIEDKEKNAFGKEVIRRWTNLRDSFAKYKKKIKDIKNSGAKVKILRTYVFSDQMQFLDKLCHGRETVDSFESESDGGLENVQEVDIEPQASTSYESTGIPKRAYQTRSRKQRKPDEVEMRVLKALEAGSPCSKMSFLRSLMPHLDKFDEQDFLQFQIEVLKVIERINERKKGMVAHPPTHFHYSTTMPAHQQFPTQPSTQPNQFCNRPSPIFLQNQNFSGLPPSFPSQIATSNRPPSYLAHQPVIATQHAVPPQPNQTLSRINEINSNQHSQSTVQHFQQFGQCTSPDRDVLHSPSTVSAESSSADNIDFGTGN